MCFLFSPCLFYCRGYQYLYFQGIGSQISWARFVQGLCLFNGLGLWKHLSPLFLHGFASICWALFARGWDWSSNHFSLLWARYQRPCHRAFCQGSWFKNRCGKGYWFYLHGNLLEVLMHFISRQSEKYISGEGLNR